MLESYFASKVERKSQHLGKIGRQAMCWMFPVTLHFWDPMPSVSTVDIRMSKPVERFYTFIRVYLSQTEDIPGNKIQQTEKNPSGNDSLQLLLCI